MIKELFTLTDGRILSDTMPEYRDNSIRVGDMVFPQIREPDVRRVELPEPLELPEDFGILTHSYNEEDNTISIIE